VANGVRRRGDPIGGIILDGNVTRNTMHIANTRTSSAEIESSVRITPRNDISIFDHVSLC